MGKLLNEVVEDVVRVAIADPDSIMVRGLDHVLSMSRTTEVAGTAAMAATVIAMVERTEPDVLLLEIGMPGAGIPLIARIVSHRPRTRVIVYTALQDDRLVTAALRAGASAYLTKRANAAELLAAIQHVALGELYLEPQLGFDMLAARRSAAGPSGSLVRAPLVRPGRL